MTFHEIFVAAGIFLQFRDNFPSQMIVDLQASELGNESSYAFSHHQQGDPITFRQQMPGKFQFLADQGL